MSEQPRQHSPLDIRVATEHYHVASDQEARLAMDLMLRMGVSCGLRGFHSHTYEEGKRVVTGVHHHHDLRCLVEAGMREIEPKVIEQKNRADRLADRTRSLRASLEQWRGRLADSEHRVEALEAEGRRRSRFMSTMPAVGPWKTIQEQYEQWLEESQREQS